jgi:F0F1-type ATP synthase membrane subunit b/b'
MNICASILVVILLILLYIFKIKPIIDVIKDFASYNEEDEEKNKGGSNEEEN